MTCCLPILSAQALSPDPVGSINGKVAINVIPVTPDPPTEGKPLPTVGCAVHLVDAEEQITRWSYPCGDWFQPPVGRYLFWLEQGSTVSFQSILSYAGEPFTRSGLLLAKTMYPSGFVLLEKGTRVPSDGTVRLISLERVETYRPYDRRLDGPGAADAIRIPIGRMIAGVFDRHGQALALSRPLVVPVGETITATPRAPSANRSDVVAVWSRAGLPGPVPCDVRLKSDQKSIASAVDFQTQERLVAVWYDLPSPADVQLSVDCGDTQPFARSLRLQPGATETIRGFLAKPLPPIQSSR